MERRADYIIALHHQLGEAHPLVQLVEHCLDNDPSYRPTAGIALQQLEGVVIDDPYHHLTKLDLIQLVQQQRNPKVEEEIQRLQTQMEVSWVNVIC